MDDVPPPPVAVWHDIPSAQATSVLANKVGTFAAIAALTPSKCAKRRKIRKDVWKCIRCIV